MARNGYMCVETTFLPRSVCFSLQSTADVENGAIVGKGELITNEDSVYKALTDYSDGKYLVANPAWIYENYRAVDRNEENYINKADKAFRAYRLDKDMKYKVYNLDLAEELAVGDAVKFEGGKYVKDTSTDPELKIVFIEELGFPYCVGSAGVETTGFGYAIGEVTKKYTIEVLK